MKQQLQELTTVVEQPIADGVIALPVSPVQTVEELPQAGGTYLRQGDGSLDLVAGTAPAPDRASSIPGAAAAQE